MKKTANLQKFISLPKFLTGGALMVALVFSFVAVRSASAMITSSLDLGSTESQVTELQTYLSTNSSIYPSGLVTGYFGPLTQAGVQRFQATQGIVTSGSASTTGYGRVGPITRQRINELMGSGSQTFWDIPPILSNSGVQYTSTTATFTWVTNEATQGQVYWSTSPLQMNEATGPRQQPYVSGTLALDAGGFQTNHTVTVSNLQPNTTYYYVIRGVDNTGNMSIIWPSTFRTNQ